MSLSLPLPEEITIADLEILYAMTPAQLRTLGDESRLIEREYSKEISDASYEVGRAEYWDKWMENYVSANETASYQASMAAWNIFYGQRWKSAWGWVRRGKTTDWFKLTDLKAVMLWGWHSQHKKWTTEDFPMDPNPFVGQ